MSNLFVKDQKNDNIVLTASAKLKEDHMYEADLPTFSLESGNILSEHVVVKPPVVSFSIEYANILGDENREIKNNFDLVGVNEREAALDVSRNALSQVMKWMKAATKLKVITAHAIYSNMAIKQVTSTHKAPYRDQLTMDITFQQIGIAGSGASIESTTGLSFTELSAAMSQLFHATSTYALMREQAEAAKLINMPKTKTIHDINTGIVTKVIMTDDEFLEYMSSQEYANRIIEMQEDKQHRKNLKDGRDVNDNGVSDFPDGLDVLNKATFLKAIAASAATAVVSEGITKFNRFMSGKMDKVFSKIIPVSSNSFVNAASNVLRKEVKGILTSATTGLGLDARANAVLSKGVFKQLSGNVRLSAGQMVPASADLATVSSGNFWSLF